MADGTYIEIVIVKKGQAKKHKVLVSEILGDAVADFCKSKCGS